MDDVRVGSMLRAARIRRGWRQADVAAAAGVSAITVSRIERGHIGAMTHDVVRRVAAALEVRVELLPRSRSADLDWLVNARHSALADAVLARLARVSGWVAQPEVSFSIYGERGVVDVLAWHREERAVLVIELKTEIVDVGELLGTLDRKRRLAARILDGSGLGHQPARVGVWLIVGEGPTNRRRLAAHATTFRAVLPADGREVRGWLGRPMTDLRALSFLSDERRGIAMLGFSARRRVRGPRPRAPGPSSRPV